MIDLRQYGFLDDIYDNNIYDNDGLLAGRVTEMQKDHYIVVTGLGEVTAVLKGALIYDAVVRADLPCVGDFVTLRYNAIGASIINGILPRHSKFSRSDFYGHSFAHIKADREQVIAVNFDYVFILTSLNKDFKVNRIMRYLTQGRQSGGIPVVILTKADLAENFEQTLADVRAAAPDVPVYAISAYTGYGLDGLNTYLRPGKTIVFLGMSGVGKSSLLNVLMEREVMVVKEIREDDSRGRHTTTHRQLFMLPSGAMVIDTPGMRELGLHDADEGISAGFSDIEALFSQCRFSDCKHASEPGCAVHEAITGGSLAQKQWDRYISQKRETSYADDKTSYLLDKRSKHKAMAMRSRQGNKGGKSKKP